MISERTKNRIVDAALTQLAHIEEDQHLYQYDGMVEVTTREVYEMLSNVSLSDVCNVLAANFDSEVRDFDIGNCTLKVGYYHL